MRGGFSSEIKELRSQLINFASLIALELDFAEEDVEFADRTAFYKLLDKLKVLLKTLIDSFALGNVIKKGIPVAIAGEPNVGKSTLLNALLQEEKALVSDIAGTTRDAIEDEIVLDGICFRFIDTAGIRETSDSVESMGIERTFKKMEQASIILYILDSNSLSDSNFADIQKNWTLTREKYSDKQHLLIFNKSDLIDQNLQQKIAGYFPESIQISAKNGIALDALKNELLKFNNMGLLNSGDPVISNARHYEALVEALASLNRVREGMDKNIPIDLVTVDINQALYHLGKITGEISTEDLLGNIFANFCIGK
jgi:tRNA modification GTPase